MLGYLTDIVGSQTLTWLIYYRESESFSGWIVEYQMFKFGKKKRGTRPDWPCCYCSPWDAPCWDAPRQFIYLPALELRAQSAQHCCILPLYPALQWRHLVWLRIDWVPLSVVSRDKLLSDIVSSLLLFNSHSPIFIGIVILVASRLVICSAL